MSHMRARIFSSVSPKGDVWWRHFRWKGPTRADITQLPVTHARTLSGSRDCMLNGTVCTTTLVRKKRGDMTSLPVTSIPITWLTSLSVTAASAYVTSGDLMHAQSSDPLDPLEIRLEPCWYTTHRPVPSPGQLYHLVWDTLRIFSDDRNWLHNM